MWLCTSRELQRVSCIREEGCQGKDASHRPSTWSRPCAPPVAQNTFEYVDLATALRTPLGAKMRGAGMDLLGLVRALDRLEGKLGRRAGAGDMEVAMEVAREEERAEGAEEVRRRGRTRGWRRRGGEEWRRQRTRG